MIQVIDSNGNLKVVQVVSTTIGSAINAISAGTDIITGGTAIFSNANGVSFGVDGQTITASVNAGGLAFSNSNNVSFGVNAGTVTASASFSQSNQNLSLYALGNTTQNSSTLLNASNLSFKGTGNISVGFSNGSILFSQSGGAGGAAISAGGNSQNTGTIVFSNSNGVSFGLSNDGVLTATVKTDYQSSGAYLTTAMQSNAVTISNVNLSAGTTSNNLSAMVFSNSNGVSFGLSGSTVTATVATNYQSQGAYLTTAMQSNAATISNIKVSAGTLSQTRSDLTFADSNGLSFGLETNGIITGTVKTDYQSSGNYLTTAMASDAGSRFVNTSAGLNLTNISATFNSNSISLSVAAPSAAQTAISGIIASDATYTSGTVSFKDGNGISFASTTGQIISITHGLQFTSATSAITSNALNTSASRVINILAATNNTGGGTASLSSNVSFSNANNMTFYTSAGNAIVASFSQSVDTAKVGLNTAQTNVTWTVNSSGISLNAGGYAGTNTAMTGGSVTLNTSGISINLPAYLTTADLSQNSSKYIQEWALTGNTAGTTSSAQGTRLYLSGGNNITLSGSSNSIVFQVANFLTTARASNDAVGLNTAQTNVTWTVNSSGISLNAGGYAGTNTATTGNISVTLNTSGISINAPAFLTTADLSQNSSKYIQNWKLTGNTAGTTSSAQGTDLWLGGGNGVTISGSSNTLSFSVATNYQSQGAYLTTADLSQNSSKYVQAWELTGNTAGTTSSAQGTKMYFQGGNSLTVSGSSNSIVFSVGNYLTTAMASNRGSDFVAATAAFAGTNANGTIASNGISVSVAAQSNQTIGGYATGNTGGQSSSSTFDARSFSVSGVGNLTAGYSGGMLLISGGTAAPSPIIFSAGTSSGSISSVVFSNSNNVSFGLNGSTITAQVPQTSSLSATGAQSISVNGSTISIGVPYISLTADNGSSLGSLSQIYFSNANGVSFGLSTSNNGSATLTASVAAGGNINLSAGTTSNNLTNFVLSNSNNISFGLSGSTVTASYKEPSISFFANINNWANMGTGASAITQTSGSSMFIQPFVLYDQLSGSYLRLNASFNDSAVGTAGTTQANTTFSAARYTTIALVVYTQGTGASSRSIQSIYSTSAGLTGITQYGAGVQASRYTITISKSYPQLGLTTNLYTTSYAVSSGSIVVSSDSNTLFTGARYLDIPFATNLSQGMYWLGVGASTSSASQSSNISFVGTGGMAISLNAVTQTALSMGLLGALTSASDYQLFPGLGVWTTNASTFNKDSIGLNSISQVANNPQLPFQIIRVT